jgi:hypothetical protein
MPPTAKRRKPLSRTRKQPPNRPAPEPADVQTAADIEGALVALNPNGLVGWAWRPAQPDVPVTVVVQSDGIEVARGLADRFDDEAMAAHGQPGRPGFCLRLHHLPDGVYPRPLQLHDLSGRKIGAPFIVREIAQLLPVTDVMAPQYEGSIDEMRDGVISGWARDGARPDIALTVELLDSGETVSRVRADGFREDLLAAGKGAGRHSYRLPLPTSLLDGRGHSLRVRITGSEFELPNGPIAFGPLPSGDPMIAVQELRNEVHRLTERVDALSDPSSRLLGDVVRRLSERIAALAEIQREAVERELDALRRMAFARPDIQSAPKTKPVRRAK